jgi:hypothetical protein
MKLLQNRDNGGLCPFIWQECVVLCRLSGRILPVMRRIFLAECDLRSGFANNSVLNRRSRLCRLT